MTLDQLQNEAWQTIRHRIREALLDAIAAAEPPDNPTESAMAEGELDRMENAVMLALADARMTCPLAYVLGLRTADAIAQVYGAKGGRL